MQCAANLYTITNSIRPVWDIRSLWMHVHTKQRPILTFECSLFCNKLVSLHIISVPFFGSHTGVAQSEMHCKLIGTVSDGAPNTTSAISGVIIRLHQDSLGGFYRVWYLLHQFDIRFK